MVGGRPTSASPEPPVPLGLGVGPAGGPGPSRPGGVGRTGLGCRCRREQARVASMPLSCVLIACVFIIIFLRGSRGGIEWSLVSTSKLSMAVDILPQHHIPAATSHCQTQILFIQNHALQILPPRLISSHQYNMPSLFSQRCNFLHDQIRKQYK